MQDNGIKFFTNKGFKLDDSVEDEIEKILYEDYEFPIGKDVGRYINDSEQASNMYVNHLLKSLVARESPKVRANGRPLEGLKICVDAANGAASLVGPMALRKAGAEVIVINASPDGYNINDNSGSTHPEQLQAITKASGADMGVAFDGDADRCIAVDANGEIVDGDKIIAILAKSLQDSGALQKNTVVVTVMSNKGFLLAMENAGINTIQANVGDRYVLEEMLKGGYNLGGEQSGHVINLDAATTGDGVLTALNLALSIVKSGKTLTDLASIVKKLPQALVNVANVDKTKTDNPVLQEEIRKVEDFLGDEGRVLLRPSGTEPVVRVMVEAKTQELADGLAQELADTLKKQTGL
jgi:phosphoglucosamine mutase